MFFLLCATILLFFQSGEDEAFGLVLDRAYWIIYVGNDLIYINYLKF